MEYNEHELTLSPEELDMVTRHHTPPQGITYTIRQAAQLSGVQPWTLRYWESLGLLRPPRLFHPLPTRAHRRYSDADIARIRRILGLCTVGYTLRGAKRCLEVQGAEA